MAPAGAGGGPASIVAGLPEHRRGVRRAVAIAITLGLAVGCGRIGYDPLSPRDAGVDSAMDASGSDSSVDAGSVDAASADAASADAASVDAASVDAPACPPILGGLVGWWPMDMSGVDGTTVRDVSSGLHHGTFVGTPAPIVVPGRIEQALDFGATTLTSIDLAGVPLSSSPGAFHSVALWMFNDDAMADEGVFCVNATPTAEAPRYCLWLTNRKGPRNLCINGGTGECWGISDENILGRWVHVVAVFANGPTDGGSLFIDGAPAAMACQFGTCDQARTAAGPVMLGMNESVYAWHGRLDDVRLYDRALTAAEVAQLYACAP